jgi:hypothetical protein
MEALNPVMEYFENKASSIICKYSLSEPFVTLSTPSKALLYQTKLQKIEQELDGEINNILSNYQSIKSIDGEALITALYFHKEKAKYEFSKKQSIG